jgi:hypothetical protein
MSRGSTTDHVPDDGHRHSCRVTYDRYGHLFPEIDKQAAQKLERVRF